MSSGLSGWLYAYEVPSPPLAHSSSLYEAEATRASQQVDQERVNSQASGEEGDTTLHTKAQVIASNEGGEKEEALTKRIGRVAVDEWKESEKQERQKQEGSSTGIQLPVHDGVVSTGVCVGKDEQRGTGSTQEEEEDSDERTDSLAAARKGGGAAQTVAAHPTSQHTSPSPSHTHLPLAYSPGLHGFIFAVHRRTVSSF